MMVAALSAAAAIYWAAVPWTFPLTVALGGLATYIWNWNVDMALHVRTTTLQLATYPL